MISDTLRHGPGAGATPSAPPGERGQRATAREQALPGAVARALDSLLGGAAPTAKARQMEGEFRYVTVAFVDISGFTALSETMDPEDLHDLVNACLQPLSACIYRYGGSIDKYIGDCIMAVFGAPVAQEDDAERCVLACLDMMDVLTTVATQRQVDLKLHTGINTGQVVAGAIGAARDAAYTMMGDTVNTASRLEGVAAPGQILVADSTYRLTRHAIVYEPSPPVVVKGKRQPLTGHFARRRRAVRASPRGFADRETPYIGRDAEQRVVRAALDRLRRGQGGLLELAGEAGTGKSRLAAELQRAAALPPFQPEQQAVDWVEGRCLSFGEHIPFWLPMELIRYWLQIEQTDSQAEVRAKLATGVQTLFGPLPDVSPAWTSASEGAVQQPRSATGSGLERRAASQRPSEPPAPATAGQPGASATTLPHHPGPRAHAAAPRPRSILSPIPRPASAGKHPLRPLRPIAPAAPLSAGTLPPLAPLRHPSAPAASSAGKAEADRSEIPVAEGTAPQQHGGTLDGPAILALLRVLFSLPPEHRFVESLEPQVRQRLTVRALVTILRRRAQERPLIVVGDDLHWADPASLEFLDALVAAVPAAPILLVVIARPDFQHEWADALPAECRHQLTLNPLPPDDTEQLVHDLFGEHQVPTALVQRLIERAEGNPFFLEELVKSVLESGMLQRIAAGEAIDAEALAEIEIPHTVHAVLMARIDRLEESARRLLQAASAIGYEFLQGVLSWLAEANSELEREVDERLAHLQQRRVVQPVLEPADPTYAFQHHMMQEITYDTLLRRRRRRYHRHIATALEALFPSRRDEFLEIIAQHSYLSQDWPHALAVCLEAGRKAASLYANQEAITHFNRAIECGQVLLERAGASDGQTGGLDDDDRYE